MSTCHHQDFENRSLEGLDLWADSDLGVNASLEEKHGERGEPRRYSESSRERGGRGHSGQGERG